MSHYTHKHTNPSVPRSYSLRHAVWSLFGRVCSTPGKIGPLCCIKGRERALAASGAGKVVFFGSPILKIDHLGSATEPQQQRNDGGAAADSVDAI